MHMETLCIMIWVITVSQSYLHNHGDQKDGIDSSICSLKISKLVRLFTVWRNVGRKRFQRIEELFM
jgi:hypothetical protein